MQPTGKKEGVPYLIRLVCGLKKKRNGAQMGAVYLIRNNNKKLIYIGKDNDDSAKTRWADHLSGSRFHCLSLRKAMAEDGTNNFTCRVIENGLFRDELRDVEMWWIRVFNAADPAVGYNTMGKIPRGEDPKKYRAKLLKSDPLRGRIYERLLKNMDTNDPDEIVSIPFDPTFAKNEASSVDNDTQFIAECEAKGLRPATKDDIGAKVLYVWKTYSNEKHTGTLGSFNATWAKIVNDKPEIVAKWRYDEIEWRRGVIFVIE